jgi:hypothetical protein
MSLRYIVCFLMISLSFSLNAQNSSRDVPAVVEKNFNKKFPRAENVSWDKIDTNFKVDCFFEGRGTYVEFAPSGKWILTVTDLDVDNLLPPIQSYLDEHFKKDKVIVFEQAISSDKKGYFYVQIAREEKDRKEPWFIELFFDKTGNIEQVKTPEGFKDLTVVGIDDPNNQTPSAVIDAWQKRFPKAEEITWVKNQKPADSIPFDFIGTFSFKEQKTKAEFLPDGTWIETRIEFKKKDLYEPVALYIEENHWFDDFIIAERITTADRKDFYYVKLERMQKGQMHPYVFELFFDKMGKLIKANRDQELKNQFLLTVDVPPMVAKKFNSRFTNAADVKWETKDGNWVSHFVYREQVTTAEFSDTAWISTMTEQDVKNLYAPVQRILDTDYSDYRIIYAEKTIRADHKDFYYVELISKKKREDDQKLGMFFDKTGKLKKD